MKVVFVQTYPLYHEIPDTDSWLKLENRDKWMPALTAAYGHETELWAAGFDHTTHRYECGELPGITIRIFPADSRNARSKHHNSRALTDAARRSDAALFVLKGIDGGVGLHLARKFLVPEKIPFALVIGGEWYRPLIRHACAVLVETGWQAARLKQPGWRVWRANPDPEKLIRLPKSVDTGLFRPVADATPEYDVVSTGRLISYYKNYQALFSLGERLTATMIGGGSALDRYRQKHPYIRWYGQIPHHQVPGALRKGRLFFYPGLRDHFPRVIVEAAACGLPVAAFADVIGEEVLPARMGLRLSRQHYALQIVELLADGKRLKEMGECARVHALKHWSKYSSREAIGEMLKGCGGNGC